MNKHITPALIAVLSSALLLLSGCGGRVNVGTGGGLLGLVLLALVIWALVDIVQSGRPDGNKILWALIIILLPVIGLILYVLIGRK